MAGASDLGAIETKAMSNVQDDRLEAAGKIVARACGWSAAAAFIPLPIIDLAGLAAVQATMINDIAKLYGQSFSKDATNNVISVLLGSLIPGYIGSGLKAMPGIGTIVGFFAFSAFAAASTYALGKIILRHFEKGGTVSTFDPGAISEDFKKEFATAQKSKQDIKSI